MADETLEAARQHLLEQRAQIDQAIAALDAVLGGTTSSPEGLGTAPTGNSPPRHLSQSRGGEVTAYPGEFFQLSVTKATEKILKRAGRPMKTLEILAVLRRAEFPLRGRTPEGSLYTSLKRSKDFVKVLPNTWALTEWHPDAAAAEAKPMRKPAKKRGRRQKRTESESESKESRPASLTALAS